MNLTKQDFRKAIEKVIDIGITTERPLGKSGETIILYQDYKNKKTQHRCSQVSIRLHNSSIELLITDIKGDFIVYNQISMLLGIDTITNEHFRTFNFFKEKIPLDINMKMKVVNKLVEVVNVH